MSRALHTLSTFGFAAAAAVGFFVIRPWAAAAGFAAALLLVCLVLQRLRDETIAAEAARSTRDLFSPRHF